MNNRTYRILLDGKWSLEDLMIFSRIYFQNYSFLYCLETHAVGISSSKIASVLNEYELRSGYHYASIYEIFRSHIDKDDLPQIKSIQYASPGWMDLALNPEVALQFAKVIGIYLGTPVAVGETYKRLHKIYTDLDKRRKETKITSLKLQRTEIAEANKLTNELAKGLGFESLEQLDSYTKDPEESARLLMAHCRRIKKIAKFAQSDKAFFPHKLHD